MTLFVAALLALAAGSLLAFVPGLSRRRTAAVCAATTLVGCGLGLAAALRVLAGGPVPTWNAPWPVPGGEFALSLDPLSSLFLALHFAVSGAAAVFGASYFAHPADGGSAKSLHFFFSGFIALIALTFTAANAVLFLVVWELMALAGYFLVTFRDRDPRVRRAGLLYLVATHAGTACLVAAFVLLGERAGSYAFQQMAGSEAVRSLAPAVFVLVLVGFGVKAGFMPLHVWLPEAHPAAPSPVSALMSGVMIKTGVYGLLRVLSFFPDPPAWWGVTLIAVGVVSGVLGVLWALAQSDFKRLLAYSSIDNVGIIGVGLGLGFWGLSRGDLRVAALGFVGGLWHAVNHAVFKSLLFLGAGSALHAAGTVEMDRLGGLAKKMPVTAFCVLVGSVAICGLPPLNGFVGEWLIYVGFFQAQRHAGLLALAGVTALALIGVGAVACFTKAFGAQFLGTARSAEAARAKESDGLMLAPMLALGAACLVGGLFPGALFPAFERAAAVLLPLSPAGTAPLLGGEAERLSQIGRVSIGFLAVAGLLSLVRIRLLRGRTVTKSSTWGCGYSGESPRAQYTSSSFAQFPLSLFRSLVAPAVREDKPAGYFPLTGSFESRVPDAVLDRFLEPLYRLCRDRSAWVLRLQHGRMQSYLVYMVVFLLALLIGQFGGIFPW